MTADDPSDLRAIAEAAEQVRRDEVLVTERVARARAPRDVTHRRALLRRMERHQELRIPRSIPNEQFSELLARLGSHRDRALAAFWLSTGARASKLLSLDFESRRRNG